MPTYFNKNPATEVDGNSQVDKGLIAGTYQGFQAALTDDCAPRRLQKSVSLDETKTKLATCIIRSVLTKKMQGEQSSSSSSEYHNYSNTKCSCPQGAAQTTRSNCQPVAEPNPPPSRQLERGRKLEGELAGEGEAAMGFGVFKACVHVVRDMRSLVKNTYSPSFRNNTRAGTTLTVIGQNSSSKLSMFKAIGQEESPPPSYQHAVGIKGHIEGSQLCPQPLLYNITSKKNNVGTALHLSQHRKDGDQFNHIPKQRRSNEPVLSKTNMALNKTGPVVLLDTPTTEPNQSEKGECLTSEHPSDSTPSHTTPPQAHNSILVPPYAPGSTQTPLPSHFPSVLTGYTNPLSPHLGILNYIHGPLSYIQTQLPQPSPVQLLRLSEAEDNHKNLTCPSYQPDGDKGLAKSDGPYKDGTGQPQWNSNKTPQHTTTQQPQQPQQLQQQLQQQQLQFLLNVQGFLPAPVGSPFITLAVAPGKLYNGHTPHHVMLDTASGRSICVDMPFQPQRKMLLDPETGRYFEVLLPAAAVMPYQPPLAVPTLYAPPCLPFSVLTQPIQLTHTKP
ncbi:uncharacterized protein LOC143016250 [Genypterus blacodes]|uniref:uncharacterized protein LOC143016250 n=1 Tax=Genypterus blacodes TaxID=154954 RepID=UPI003F777C72